MSRYITPEAVEHIAATIAGMGFRLAGNEWIGGPVPVWRIYVEGQNNTPVNMAEITTITKQLGAVLDVELPNMGRYRLEVSSPGLDRRLFTLEDFQRFQGATVKMRLHTPVEERRNWTGEIVDVLQDTVTIKMEDKIYTFAFENIERANVVPNFKK